MLICSTQKFSKCANWPGIDSKVLDLFTYDIEQNFSKTRERFLANQAIVSEKARQDKKTIKRTV